MWCNDRNGREQRIHSYCSCLTRHKTVICPSQDCCDILDHEWCCLNVLIKRKCKTLSRAARPTSTNALSVEINKLFHLREERGEFYVEGFWSRHWSLDAVLALFSSSTVLGHLIHLHNAAINLQHLDEGIEGVTDWSGEESSLTASP